MAWESAHDFVTQPYRYHPVSLLQLLTLLENLPMTLWGSFTSIIQSWTSSLISVNSCKDSLLITMVFGHVDSSTPSCELGCYRITTAYFTQEHVELSLIWQHAIGCLQNVQQLIPLRNTSSLLRQDNNLSADHGFYQGLFQSITNVPKGWFSSQVHLAEPNLEPINKYLNQTSKQMVT